MTNQDGRGDELSPEEIAEAAVTLATLPEGDRLPSHVRERIEVRARALLGDRAKAHARKRAEERTRDDDDVPSRNLQSTTSAGSQVYGAFDEPAARGPSRLFGWSGWALAAAAAVALFVLSREPSRTSLGASSGEPAAPSVRLALEGDGRVAGELRYDPARGTVSLSLTAPPAVDATRESLQLWVAFQGDVAPRPVALLDGPSLAVGEGARLCQGDPSRGAPCTAIREALVTREALGGSLVFSERKVVLRSSRGSP